MSGPGGHVGWSLDALSRIPALCVLLERRISSSSVLSLLLLLWSFSFEELRDEPRIGAMLTECMLGILCCGWAVADTCNERRTVGRRLMAVGFPCVVHVGSRCSRESACHQRFHSFEGYACNHFTYLEQKQQTIPLLSFSQTMRVHLEEQTFSRDLWYEYVRALG